MPKVIFSKIKICSKVKHTHTVSSLHGLTGRDCGKHPAFESVGRLPSLWIGAGPGCKAGVDLRSTPQLSSGDREVRKHTHG